MKINKFKFTTFLFISFIALFFCQKRVLAQTGSLTFDPSSANAGIGQTVTLKVMMNTGEDEVNSVNTSFTYPQALLQFVSIDDSHSVFDKLQEQSGASGLVTIERYTESFFIGNGEIARVTFKTLSAGAADLAFTSDAALVTGYDDPPDALATKGTGRINVSTLPATGIDNDSFSRIFFIVISLLLLNLGGLLFLQNKKDFKNFKSNRFNDFS